MTVRHGPIPAPGNRKVTLRDTRRLDYEERVHRSRRRLIPHRDLQHVEQQLQSHLGLQNRSGIRQMKDFSLRKVAQKTAEAASSERVFARSCDDFVTLVW